jgi:rare lipoprotein A
MNPSKIFWLSFCASLAFGILILISITKVGGEHASPVPIISAEPIPTPTRHQEPQSIYYNGKASYYNRTYCEKHNPNCITASGEVFDDTAFTCACASRFKLGSLLKVKYQENEIVVRCNDRGNFESKGRILDLSQASFEALAPLEKGILEVKIEVLSEN